MTAPTIPLPLLALAALPFAALPLAPLPFAPLPFAPLQTAPGVPPGGSAPVAAEWGGSLAEGLARVAQLSRDGEHEGALALTEQLLATEFEDRAPEVVRAEVHYARGRVRAAAEETAPAVEAYRRARALAGAGGLRLDATYNAGVALLEEAERHRARIPEVSGGGPGAPGTGAVPGAATPLPAVPGAPGSAPSGAPQGPDPLAAARASYGAARDELVERLRAEWRDEDTRANLELVQKRLRELDEIEREREQREEEQQDQQDQQDQQEQQEQDPQQGEGEQDGEPSESEETPPEESEPAGEESPQEMPEETPEETPEEPQEREQQEADEGEPQEQDPRGSDEQAPPAGEEEQPRDPHEADPAGAQPAEEQHLTREEALRLLDRLAEIEAAAQKLEAMLRQHERVPVERDW